MYARIGPAGPHSTCYDRPPPLVRRNRPSGRVSGPSGVSFPDQGGCDDGLRDGPEKRPGGRFRRTKGGGRSAQVLCGPAGPILAEIHQPSALGATLKLSRWCRARRGISNKYQQKVGNPSMLSTNHRSPPRRNKISPFTFRANFLVGK